MQVHIVTKLRDKDYGENEISFRYLYNHIYISYYHGQYYEATNEDDLGEILSNDAVHEVKSITEENHYVVQTCHLKLNMKDIFPTEL